MMDELDSNALTFDGPALYRIRVRGEVPARLSGRLEAMSLVVETSGGPPTTTLTGDLHDQASLAQVLGTLYELHLPVLSVECLNAGRVQISGVQTQGKKELPNEDRGYTCLPVELDFPRFLGLSNLNMHQRLICVAVVVQLVDPDVVQMRRPEFAHLRR